MTDLDWLFEIRDAAVHHDEGLRPPAAIDTYAEPLSGPQEAVDYSAESACRAESIAFELIGTCMAHPKSATRRWVDARQAFFDGAAARRQSG